MGNKKNKINTKTIPNQIKCLEVPPVSVKNTKKPTLNVEDVEESPTTNKKKRCAACGYPDAKLRRYDGWATKVAGRKGMGTGRLRYVKTIARRAKNVSEPELPLKIDPENKNELIKF